MGQTPRHFFTSILLLFAGFTGFLFPAVLHAGTPQVEKIRIEILEAPGEESRYTGIARSLIFLKEGRPFSGKLFSQSIEALRNSTVFKSIDVPDPEWSAPAVTLVFRLVPFPRIRNITIAGGFPILEKEIRNAMTITTGGPYSPEDIPEQVNLVKTLFRAEGFISPRITYYADKIYGENDYVLHVDIDKGAFYSVKRLILNGNDAFTDIRVKARLRTWKTSFLIGGPSRLVDKELRADVETLRNFYWQEQYCDAEVKADTERDADTGYAIITCTIDQGPRYDVDITGNRFFWKRTLVKELVIYERGNRGGFGLRKSARNIQKKYRDAGFLDADVQVEDTPVTISGRDIRRVRFVIDEGPRYFVNRMEIAGNAAITNEQIRDQILTGHESFLPGGPFSPDILDEDVRAIKTLYTENGYLSAAVEPKTARHNTGKNTMKVDVRIDINEGPRTLVSSLEIKGVRVDPKEIPDLLEMRTGTPYRPDLLNESKNAIAARISEDGYPHVTVEPKVNVSPDNTRAEIVYEVTAGPYVEMGETIFIGNFDTKQRVLLKEMALNKTEPFSLKKMLASQRNIRDVNALESVQFQTIGLEENADRVDLLAEVHEKKPYYIQLTTGYDTWRRFYVDSSVGDINFLGLDNEVRAGLQMSEIGYMTELGITDPRLWGTRIAANGTVYAEEVEELNQNFGIRSYGASATFTRNFLKHFSGSLNLRSEQREQYRTGGEVAQEDADFYDPRTVLVTTPGVIYNNTNSFVRPTRGIFSSLKMDISKGLKNSLDDFYKYQVDAHYYFTPLKPLTFAFRSFAGYIDPMGPESNIPQDQLFYLGGTADVRGFDENTLRTDSGGNPVGGRTALLGSIEIRYDLGLNFELFTFCDTGTILDPLANEGTDSWRSGAGSGLRYVTPIGPIGLMYGWKLDRREGESAGAVHFSIGYTF